MADTPVSDSGGNDTDAQTFDDLTALQNASPTMDTSAVADVDINAISGDNPDSPSQLDSNLGGLAGDGGLPEGSVLLDAIVPGETSGAEGTALDFESIDGAAAAESGVQDGASGDADTTGLADRSLASLGNVGPSIASPTSTAAQVGGIPGEQGAQADAAVAGDQTVAAATGAAPDGASVAPAPPAGDSTVTDTIVEDPNSPVDPVDPLTGGTSEPAVGTSSGTFN
ncbi:MAG: hypothetical protein RLZZ141_993, partial [Pseudomonadota bacterium]